MSKSVKVNYVLNVINTSTQVLLPLISFPYASRILLAYGIGHVNFFNSIISYISIFTCLGIPMYAIREIARVRDDVKQMNIKAVEILLLHAMLTFFGYIIVALFCLFVPQIKADVSVFLVLSLTIFFTAIGCEWFYQGIEDFKYITIRGLIVKALSLVFLFVFVKTKNDIIWYAVFTVFGTLGGNIFNFFRLRKYINKDNIIFKDLRPFSHLKSVLKVFAFTVVTSIYLQLNTLLLGFIKGDESVGYYTAAMKLNAAILCVCNALSTVMMPRLSNLIATGQKEEFRKMAQKSYDFSFAITLPISVGLIFVSPYAIRLLSGGEFEPSILISQIMSFTIFFIALSGVMGLQILYPLGYMNKVIKCTLIGSIIDVIACVLLIPFLSHQGAAWSYLLAEFSVTFSMFFIGKKYIPISFFKKKYTIYIIATFLMAILLWFEKDIKGNNIEMLSIMTISGIVVYFLTLLLAKDDLINEAKQIIKQRNNKLSEE
jgi:O-antigen/teichoic acid export membrane protein